MTTRTKKTPSPAALRRASEKHASKIIDKMFSHSMLMAQNEQDKLLLDQQLPTFGISELRVGRILGKGGFGTVKEILGFIVQDSTHHDDNDDDNHKKNHSSSSNRSSNSRSATTTATATSNALRGSMLRSSGNRNVHDSIIPNTAMIDQDAVADDGEESRAFIAQHCIRAGGDARYAVKYLSPEVIDDPALYLQATMDMAVETRFLSAIQHTNIVKMRAISSDPYSEEYFIVMDRLYDTLDKRITRWDKTLKKCTGVRGKVFDRKGLKTKELMVERLLDAYDLTDALAYLHKMRIVYRDLKPDNIGYDIHDDIKLFDFGLSKEITSAIPRDESDDSLFHLTATTGTIAYMAPEVALGKPYNYKCDVYSMAILLWEMLALKRPYDNYVGLKSKTANVFEKGKRPPIDKAWPSELSLLLNRAWDKDLSARHDMSTLSASLKTHVVKLRGGDESGMDHVRRRSTFVFRGSDRYNS